MEDKKRILKMVEEGKISSEDGIRLLEAIENNDIKEEKINMNVSMADDFFNIDKSKSKEKMIYIRVLSSDGEKVKVNVPVTFLKILGGGLGIGNDSLDKHNIDLEKILEAVENGFEGKIVEVDSNDGDKVLIEIG